MADYPVFNIDKDDDAPMKAFRLAKDLYERLIEAENLALMNEIKANTVVINGRKYGMLKGKPSIPPTILGMRAETKADMPDEWDFFLQKRPQQPMTNADRIRAMSDEELAKFITSGYYQPHCPVGSCPVVEDCEDCWLRWMKAEVEE